MNDELISKAALKKEIQDVVLTVADTPLSNDYTSKLIMKMGELFRKKIDDAPTFDAVEVVRCDECTFARNFRSAYVDCTYWRASVPRDGFCYCGAKMDAKKE